MEERKWIALPKSMGLLLARRLKNMEEKKMDSSMGRCFKRSYK